MTDSLLEERYESRTELDDGGEEGASWDGIRDEEEGPACPVCEGGEGFLLGRLGRRSHFRCRDCGIEWSLEEEADVRALLAVGDLSELGVVVGDKIPFDAREWRPSLRGRGWVDQAVQCVSYGRDRGDVGNQAVVSVSFDDLKREHLLGSFGPEHLYLFQGGAWRLTHL